MRVLLICQAFNALTQRLFVELRREGRTVAVEFDIHDSVTSEAISLFEPDIIVAPFLKRRIPESIWRNHVCLIVHPGIVGDRGASSLDWAILEGQRSWGVTVLQANGLLDGGDIWATRNFRMRQASKGSLYRREVTEAAAMALREALTKFESGRKPTPLANWPEDVRGTYHPAVGREGRRVDFRRDATETVLRKIRSGDSFPGAIGEVLGTDLRLYGAHTEDSLTGEAGEVVAQRDGALCLATHDGAVWVTHAARVVDLSQAHDPRSLKLPIGRILGDAVRHIQEVAPSEGGGTYRRITYSEEGAIGFLSFEFMNGAMGVRECNALLAAYAQACRRPTRVVVLLGGPDFWSNGIDLKQIEFDPHPAEESYRNIVAMNAVVRAIVETKTHVTVVAMRGNAGAGGVFMALAADRIFARKGILLNAHYRNMGNLYGSEYWTYLLPRRVGEARARELSALRLPLDTQEAHRLGLIDAHFGDSEESFMRDLRSELRLLSEPENLDALLQEKVRRRLSDEQERTLDSYAEAELAKMSVNFFGFDPSYHLARYNFVYRVPHSRTPLYLATHRARRETPHA